MPTIQELASLLIKKCTTITSLQKARQLHAHILIFIPLYLQTPYTNNNIISMYARCASLRDAQQMFDKMTQRTLVSYNALITAYSRSPQNAHLSFELFSKFQHDERLTPNALTFTSLLQAAACLEQYALGSLLHSVSVKSGLLDDICVQTSLMGMYSNCGDLECAKKVFGLICVKDVVAWNSMIYGFMGNEKIEEGLYYFGRMVMDGASPSQFTYSMVFNACSRLGDYDAGKLIHARVITTGVLSDLPLQNALLDMYSSCDDKVTALTVFSKIENPDLVSWNSMMTGCAGDGDGETIMELFVRFRRSSFGKPDEYTLAAVIRATGSFSASEYGKPLQAQVTKMGFQSSVYISSTLISMYFKNAERDSAQMIFSSLLEKDVVLWTDMISGYSRLGDGESSIRCFHGLVHEGHKVDSFALSSVISACADLATLIQGEMIHSQAMKTGYGVELNVSGSLIDMYAKIGQLQAAELILSEISRPDLKCWNSILGGYGNHGKAREAFKVLDEIIERGLAPDRVTYLSLLGACSHCGLVDMGKHLWSQMKGTGIKPGPKHYSCMTSLLCRAGLLVEAENMITESPFSDDHLEMWRTLLSSCVHKKNLSMGLRAAEQILSIDSGDKATTVLLTNLYAAVGKWNGVAEMRKKMKGLMLEKDPGLSWIEIMKSTHVFSSGDKLHPNFEEVQVEIDNLIGNLMIAETDDI